MLIVSERGILSSQRHYAREHGVCEEAEIPRETHNLGRGSRRTQVVVLFDVNL